MLIGDVRIDLGGADTTMAKHRLNTSYIGAVHQQVGGKAMPHRVGTDMFGNTRQTRASGNNPLNASCR